MTPRTLPPLAHLGRAVGILAALCLLSAPAALGMLTATLYTLAAVVLALHRESRGSTSALYPNPICECGKDYPCPTIRALGGEQS